MKKYARLLTIAGSDSGGGAGIQADLKTFSACGCYGMSAVTALTAQNTQGVTGIHPVPVHFLTNQIRAVFDDIGVDAVKIGMLHSREVIDTVARLLQEYKCDKVVLDPVMIATSGDVLIEDDAVKAIHEILFPAVQLITPNVPEAQLIAGSRVSNDTELQDVAKGLAEKYNLAVLLKAGHLTGEKLTDVLVTSDGTVNSFINKRLDTKNSHGTGCTLSSAIAAFWGKGLDMVEAVGEAEKYLHEAIAAGAEYELGGGNGPVHHFYSYWG